MKKSFLKRVAAAVVAVPVALTQTALFTSFAVDETTTKTTTSASSSKVSIDSLLKVDASAELFPAASFKDHAATKLQRFSAEELTKENAYVQFSDWGTDVALGLDAFQGKYNLEKTEILDSLKSKTGAKYEILKKAIEDKDTVITAEFTGEKIVITIDVDYAYGQDLADISTEEMNKVIARKYNDVSVTMVPKALAENGDENKLVGKIVLTADTSKIVDKTIKFDAVVNLNGAKRNGLDAVEDLVTDETTQVIAKLKLDAAEAVEAEIKNKTAELEKAKATGDAEKIAAAELALDHAIKLRRENLTKYADDLLKRMNDIKVKVDGKRGARTFEKVNATDADEVLKAADATIRRLPASVDSMESNSYYKQLAKMFDMAINTVNKQSNTGSKLAVKTSDIVDVARGAQKISVFADVTAQQNVYKANGETLFYVTDELTAADKNALKKQLDEKNELVKNNVEVKADTLVSVKVVEAKGAFDTSKSFDGDTTIDVYRVVWFDTQAKVATETTPTETTPTETKPTETTPTETKPTETTPTETKPTETTPTETKPTETTTTTRHTKVAGEIEMNVTVKTELGAGAGFYFDNDKSNFAADSMAELPKDSPEMEGEVAAGKFTVGDAKESLTPEKLYEANKAEDAYVVKALQLYYDGLKVVDKDRKPVTMTVYVGVKGDLTQDGACNAKDANRALIHAAAVGTTPDGQKLPTINDLGEVKTPAAADQDTFDKFMIFLGDVDTESVKGEQPKEQIAVNAKDANAMLRFAAQVGTNKKPGEEGYKTVSELWTVVLGSENLPAYSKNVAAVEALKKLA